jgi:hypothetical protein
MGGASSSSPSSSTGGVSSSFSSSSSAGAADLAWAQWALPPLHPTDYTITTDTVTDNVTGLMWQRVVSDTRYPWADAKTYCAGLTLGGLTGWRLPMRMELVSLVDYTAVSPTINTTVFPFAPTSPFWTASPSVDSANSAWTVNFNDGTALDFESRGSSLSVRCVR